MTDTLLATLIAERAVRRLISAYCDVVSRRDPDSAGVLFARDARVQIADGPERIGRNEIVEGLRRTMQGFSFLHQKCDTGLIDVEGGLARARIGVFESNRPAGAESLNMIFGTYEDEYRLLEEGWRFYRRRFTLQFRAVLPASEMQQFSDFVPGFSIVP